MSTSDQTCDVHLHAEIEALKKALSDNQTQLIAMESACLQESDRQVELEDSVIAWQDKYDRLYESHKRVQKVNQNLEDKLLKLVDRNSGERAQLTSDVATISVRLAQANYNIQTLQREIDRYKADMSLAIQLLQCKPDSFVPQKITSLPPEIQSKVTNYMKLDTNSQSDSEGSTSGVGVATKKSYCVLPASESPPPVCPFPPTAMVYSMRGLDAPQANNNSQFQSNHNLNINNNNNNNLNNNNNNNEPQAISPAIMAKFLEDELKASETRHCDTCRCPNKDLTVLADLPKHFSIGTQTIIQGGETNNSLCLRCNSNLNSPSRTNSPYILKLVKSSDSVISETKSSVTDSTQNDKLFTPVKKDDLMVNPILGHHRLCERSGTVTGKVLPAAGARVPMVKSAGTLRKETNDEDDEAVLMVGNCRDADGFENGLGKLSKNCNNNSIRSNSLKATDNGVKSVEKTSTPQSQSGKPLTHGVGSGSTNSLWSKTSSKEGIKMFENFNRNLIKTIKAENPKMPGPRICKMVLNTGTNNILLDNTEDIAPIIYTRRERLLDEEVVDDEEGEDGFDDLSAPITDTEDRGVSETIAIPDTVLDIAPKSDAMTMEPTNKPMETAHTKVEERKLIDLDDNSPKATPHPIKTTQSLNTANTGDQIVDIQETALLRRQQLSRVAEWVQNNSKLNVGEHNNSILNDTSAAFDNCSDVLSPTSPYMNLHNSHTAAAATTIASSSHLLPFPSKIEQQPCTNGNAATLNPPNDDIAQTSNSQHSDNLGLKRSHQSHSQLPHKSTLHKPKDNVYEKFNYFHDKPNMPELPLGPQTPQPSVDLAQMEYNVKQFMLKQNEWSIHNKMSSPPPPSTSTTTTTTNISRKLSSHLLAPSSCSNLSVNNHILNNKDAIAMNTDNNTSRSLVCNQNGRRVHRTETNL